MLTRIVSVCQLLSTAEMVNNLLGEVDKHLPVEGYRIILVR